MQFDRFQNITPAERQQYAAEGSFMRGEMFFYAVEKPGESHPGLVAGDKEFSYPIIHGGPVAVEFQETGKPPAHLMQQASEPAAPTQSAFPEDLAAELIDDGVDPEYIETLRRMAAASDDDERSEIWTEWLTGDFS